MQPRHGGQLTLALMWLAPCAAWLAAWGVDEGFWDGCSVAQPRSELLPFLQLLQLPLVRRYCCGTLGGVASSTQRTTCSVVLHILSLMHCSIIVIRAMLM